MVEGAGFEYQKTETSRAFESHRLRWVPMRNYSKDELEALLVSYAERIFGNQYTVRKNHGVRGKRSTAVHKRRSDVARMGMLLQQLQEMENV